jgi:hypothetical protein
VFYDPNDGSELARVAPVRGMALFHAQGDVGGLLNFLKKNPSSKNQKLTPNHQPEQECMEHCGSKVTGGEKFLLRSDLMVNPLDQ